MDPPLGNTSPRLSHASDRLDPSYTRTCTCTRQRPRARRRARTTFPGETLSLQRCVTLQRLLACTRAWYQSSAISVTFRTLSRDSRGDLRKVPREGTFNSNVRPSKVTWGPVTEKHKTTRETARTRTHAPRRQRQTDLTLTHTRHLRARSDGTMDAPQSTDRQPTQSTDRPPHSRDLTFSPYSNM